MVTKVTKQSLGAVAERELAREAKAATGSANVASKVGGDLDEFKKAKKTVDDILSDAVPGRETKGKSQQWEKSGGEVQANRDFGALNPRDVKEIPTGRTGVLSDGRNVNVRIKSSDGRTTLEIQNVNNSRIKIRYYD